MIYLCDSRRREPSNSKIGSSLASNESMLAPTWHRGRCFRKDVHCWATTTSPDLFLGCHDTRPKMEMHLDRCGKTIETAEPRAGNDDRHGRRRIRWGCHECRSAACSCNLTHRQLGRSLLFDQVEWVRGGRAFS